MFDINEIEDYLRAEQDHSVEHTYELIANEPSSRVVDAYSLLGDGHYEGTTRRASAHLEEGHSIINGL